MQTAEQIATDLAERISRLPGNVSRRLVAIAGAPGSGKSTIAKALCERLTSMGQSTGLVAMDGFHLDNAILDQLGLRSRKGSPDTFDVAGFVHMVDRLSKGEQVYAPKFDRSLDISIGCAEAIDANVSTVVIEGNYLLLNRPVWKSLADKWTYSIYLDVPIPALSDRLLERWLEQGLNRGEALTKIERNDLPNARLIQDHSVEADYRLLIA